MNHQQEFFFDKILVSDACVSGQNTDLIAYLKGLSLKESFPYLSHVSASACQLCQ